MRELHLLRLLRESLLRLRLHQISAGLDELHLLCLLRELRPHRQRPMRGFEHAAPIVAVPLDVLQLALEIIDLRFELSDSRFGPLQ